MLKVRFLTDFRLTLTCRGRNFCQGLLTTEDENAFFKRREKAFWPKNRHLKRLLINLYCCILFKTSFAAVSARWMVIGHLQQCSFYAILTIEIASLTALYFKACVFKLFALFDIALP